MSAYLSCYGVYQKHFFQFCTQIIVLYFLDPIQHPVFSGFLEKCVYMLISGLSEITPITSKRSNAKTENGKILLRTTARFY